MIDIKDLKSNIDKKIQESDNMIIIPHRKVDFDAIGSAIALTHIANKYKKKSHIIVNDPPYLMERGCKLIMDETKNDYSFLNKDKYLKMANKDDMFILTDVNKKNLIDVADQINLDKTIIIDHHQTDEYTLPVSENNIYIDDSISSASEIIYKLLYEYKIKIPINVARYLLAGIYLDTSKFTKNNSPSTMKVVARLMEYGATIESVSKWFSEDFESYKRVHDLVSNVDLFQLTYAIVKASNEEEYATEELAKAADEALKFGADASFVIGKLSDEKIGISARSKGQIVIDPIMKEFGGGGNKAAGAAQIPNGDIEEIGKKLTRILKPNFHEENYNK